MQYWRYLARSRAKTARASLYGSPFFWESREPSTPSKIKKRLFFYVSRSFTCPICDLDHRRVDRSRDVRQAEANSRSDLGLLGCGSASRFSFGSFPRSARRHLANAMLMGIDLGPNLSVTGFSCVYPFRFLWLINNDITKLSFFVHPPFILPCNYCQ